MIGGTLAFQGTKRIGVKRDIPLKTRGYLAAVYVPGDAQNKAGNPLASSVNFAVSLCAVFGFRSVCITVCVFKSVCITVCVFRSVCYITVCLFRGVCFTVCVSYNFISILSLLF